MDKEKKKLVDLVDRFSQKKIGVWGDFILDEYLYGNTRRISREAPVLILSYKNREYALGGAGNSILNIKALGATPLPIGIVGADRQGQKIYQMMRQQGLSTDFLFKEKDYPTPLKTRILAGEESTRKQQILRIDQEEKVPDAPQIKQKLEKALKHMKKQINALLISDYNYLTVKEPLFEKIIPDFKKSRIPVTLDSRFRLLRFRGITVATPNEPEVEGALRIEIDDNLQVLKQAGKDLLKKTQAKALLITRGSKGMILFERNKPVYAIPIHGTPDIVDVTGAGDTVISVLTLALSCGATFREATRLANYAAGLAVMKKGTATVSSQELKEAIIS